MTAVFIVLTRFGQLGLIGWASIDRFGWLHGSAILAAAWLFMPQRSLE